MGKLVKQPSKAEIKAAEDMTIAKLGLKVATQILQQRMEMVGLKLMAVTERNVDTLAEVTELFADTIEPKVINKRTAEQLKMHSDTASSIADVALKAGAVMGYAYNLEETLTALGVLEEQAQEEIIDVQLNQMGEYETFDITDD